MTRTLNRKAKNKSPTRAKDRLQLNYTTASERGIATKHSSYPKYIKWSYFFLFLPSVHQTAFCTTTLRFTFRLSSGDKLFPMVNKWRMAGNTNAKESGYNNNNNSWLKMKSPKFYKNSALGGTLALLLLLREEESVELLLG